MMKMAALLISSLLSSLASAQTFPSRPITIVVPFSVGTTADVLARSLGRVMAERLGGNVIVDNKAGEIGRAHV